ncbi:hypothetical protein [Neobacillus sp. FSL H8-0543]|uniref:hypothetical protein n=1 Tax=Neobacillus sp. FSL H8-0543 TaxID=2954672 RepID=UPI0031588825
MFLNKLAHSGLITIDYVKNGALQTFKGRVHKLNLRDQIISLKDENQNFFTIRLSGIRNVY